MKKTLCAAFLCIFIVALSAVRIHSQAQQTQDYQAIADKFFSMLRDGQSGEAIDYVFNTNPRMASMADQREQVKAQFGSLQKLVGSYVSHSKVAETNVAGMFVYQHYFVAYDRQPISLRLKFYKPGKTWLAYGLQFDADLTDEIQRQVDQNLYEQLK
jgi:hypothetical protein